MSSNNSPENDNVQIVDISEFFSADLTGTDDTPETEEHQNTYGEIDSPIKELKAIILSLDWEITDEIADSFVAEVDRLTEIWANDKSVVSFLQILRALGKYLRTHKADSHPDSVNLLYSVYNNFEKIVLTDEITPDQEQAILSEELQKFKTLKKKIASAAAAASEGKANDSLLSALKGILLDIDWQVTEQTMRKFDLEIGKLEQIWRTNNIFLTPLQMMRAIGGYINKTKQDTLPEAIKLLHTIFENFEKISLTEDMPNEERQEIINHDLEKFTVLKTQISAQKATTKRSAPADIDQVVSEEPPGGPGQSEMPGQLFDEDSEVDDIDISTVVPIDSGVIDIIMPPSDSGSETEVTAVEVDSRLDDLFGFDDQGMDITPLPDETPAPLPEAEADSAPEDITPLPNNDIILNLGDKLGAEPKTDMINEEVVETVHSSPQQPETNRTDSLLKIITEIELTCKQEDINIFTSEIDNLREVFPEASPPSAIIQIIASVSACQKAMGLNAQPGSIKLLLSLGKDLCQAEREGNHPQELPTSLHSSLEKYIHFHDSLLLPDLKKMHSRVKEIKEILGLQN